MKRSLSARTVPETFHQDSITDQEEGRRKLTEDADTGTSSLLFLSYAAARRFKELNHPRDATVKFDTDESGSFSIPRLILKQHHPIKSKIGRHICCMPPTLKAELEKKTCRGCCTLLFTRQLKFSFFCKLCWSNCLGKEEDNDEEDDNYNDDEDDITDDNTTMNGKREKKITDDDTHSLSSLSSTVAVAPEVTSIESTSSSSSSSTSSSSSSSSSSTTTKQEQISLISKRRKLLSSRSIIGDFTKYGQGVSLYFKALSFLTIMTFILSIISIAPLLVFRAVSNSSSFSSSITDSSLFNLFSTFSLGSLGDSYTTCSSGYSARTTSVSVTCPRGKITAVEASYGSPTGECNCPTLQVPTLGTCPGSVNDQGDACSPTTSKCFFTDSRPVSLPSGATFYSEPCCSSSLLNGKPSFQELDVKDGTSIVGNAGCSADFSYMQLIARGLCIGKTTCSIDTNPNILQEWTPNPGTFRTTFSTLSLGLFDTTTATPCPYPISNSGTCQVTLGAASGLTSCVDRGSSTTNPYAYRNLTGYRLLLVASCSLESVSTPSWFPFSNFISRSAVALVALITSFLIAFIFICSSTLLSKRESKHSSFATTPADYTVMVTMLPEHKSLSELESTLKRHFEMVLRNEAPDDATDDERISIAIEEETICEIADINFALRDAKGVFDLFRTRGALLHSLERLGRIELIADAERDIKGRESVREQISTVLDKIGFCDEQIDKRRGEAIVMEDVDGHFVGKLALRATAAFITFNTQEAATRAIQAYPPSFFRWLCMPRRLQMSDPIGWRPWVTRAPDPSDIHWSNVPITFLNRLLRRLINLTLLAASLFVALAIVFFVAQSKQDLLRKFPVVDCPALLQSQPRFEATSSGITLAITASKGRFVFLPSDIQISTVSNAFSKAGVVTDIYFKELGLISGNSGALNCYCSNLASTTTNEGGSSSLTALVTETFPALLVSNSTSARNNPPDRTTLCNDWLRTFLYVNGLSYGSSIITLIINIFLSTIVYGLVSYERHWNRTNEIQSRAVYLLIVQFINTGALVLLLNADIPSSLWLFRVGRFSDLTTQWYSSAGSPIVLTMLINIVLPQIYPLLQIIYASILRCIDRSCSFDRSFTRSRTQTELNNLQLGPEMALDERYAQIFTAIFVCLTYSTGMPLLIPILFLSMAIMLITDKLLFTLAYRTPPVINADLPRAFSSILPIAAITQLGIGAWMLSSEEIFPLAENLSDTSFVSSIYAFSTVGQSFAKTITRLSQWEPLSGISLGRRLTTIQSLPLFLFCALLITYVLLSPILSCCMFRLCGIERISDSCTTKRISKGQKTRNTSPTYFMAIPPDDVEAAAKGVRDIKPQLQRHFIKAYEEQSKGKAREQLAKLVEKYEHFHKLAKDAKKVIEKAVLSITESSREIHRLTQEGVMPASPDQIIADSQKIAKQATDDLASALEMAKVYSAEKNEEKEVEQVEQAIEGHEDHETTEGNDREKDQSFSVDDDINTITRTIGHEYDNNDSDDKNNINEQAQAKELNSNERLDDIIDVHEKSSIVDVATIESQSQFPSLSRRRSSARKSIFTITSITTTEIEKCVVETAAAEVLPISNNPGNPFGNTVIRLQHAGAGNPFAQKAPLPPSISTVPRAPSVRPPVTPLGNPFGSPLSSTTDDSNIIDARRQESSTRRQSSRRQSRHSTNDISNLDNKDDDNNYANSTPKSNLDIKREKVSTVLTKHKDMNVFTGYDNETLGRSVPIGSVFERNEKGYISAAPLAPSQRLLIDISSKMRDAAHTRDIARIELDKASERMKELRKRIRATIQSGRTTSKEGLVLGRSRYFASGVYSYDFHEEKKIRNEWGLNAEVNESFKRRIDDAER